MSKRTIVWAYKPVQSLRYRTGFVECDKELADLLIAEDEVQDPRIGAAFLKPVFEPPSREYTTRHLVPENPREKSYGPSHEENKPRTSGPGKKHSRG